eukprot:s850_g11.t1
MAPLPGVMAATVSLLLKKNLPQTVVAVGELTFLNAGFMNSTSPTCDVEALWTPAAAVAQEGAQAVVKYDDLVLGLARWGPQGNLRNDVPTQWRCPDLVL